MSDHSRQQSKQDSERLRKLLRSAKRVQAPWYFEAELQQRLQGKNAQRERKEHRSWFPVPAYAFSAIAVATLSIIGYMTIARSPLDVRGSGDTLVISVPTMTSFPPDSRAVSGPPDESPESRYVQGSEPGRPGPSAAPEVLRQFVAPSASDIDSAATAEILEEAESTKVRDSLHVHTPGDSSKPSIDVADSVGRRNP